jgi:fido (protein-threonine AMPylation protein)
VAVEFEYAPGATPLDLDEAAGLVPKHITHQGDLNAWEQANIFQANRWAARQTKRDLLDEGFVRDLHRQMFDKTWLWAGTFRKSNKNIGVDWTQVAVKLRDLLDNTRYQCSTRFLVHKRLRCGSIISWFGYMHLPMATVGTPDSWPICWPCVGASVD